MKRTVVCTWWWLSVLWPIVHEELPVEEPQHEQADHGARDNALQVLQPKLVLHRGGLLGAQIKRVRFLVDKP